MRLSPETVAKLQADPSCIRNICILAHVDHGKTSLSDSLLATNGIISQRMAGKARFLDSREDEQLRGITMEASAISLYFKVVRKQAQEAGDGSDAKIDVKEHLINLIDSPGHIDFSSEVSTASRLCDGAVVLVDVVEGVLSQTVNVLRQCWVDGLKPILVLNKIDRLIIEWKLSPAEAYQHLSRVVEQVNSVLGSFYSGERMQDDMIWREGGRVGDFQEKDDADIYFAPELNNVIFASAIDGWAFSVNTFAKIYAAKLGFSHSVLSKTLWGDFYLDMKNKKILPGKKLKASQLSLKPLFVGLILEPIWAVYENAFLERNDEKLEKIIAKLGVAVSPRDMKSKDLKSLLNSIMSQWLPISHAVLGMVIDFLPSPAQAQAEKIEKLLTECVYNVFPEVKDHSSLIEPELEAAMKNCDSSEPEKYTLAYTSKMISVPNDELPKEVVKTMSTAELAERTRKAREVAQKASEAAAVLQEQQKAEEDEFMLPPATPFEWEFEEDDFEEQDEAVADETLIAFTRVFSGSLSKGQKVTVIGPKYDPSLPNDSLTNKPQVFQEVEIQDLFLIMGRELIRIDSVPAGNIVGIVGMDNIIIKNGTICSPSVDATKPYINLASTSTLIHNKPIMQIAVEPTNLLKLGKLERGLNLLAKADPVFEWYIDDDSGEIIMCVSGELHLERCIKDLQDRFAKGCEVVVKEPVIPFREGLAPDGSSSYVLEDDEVLSRKVEDLELDFKVVALPSEVVKFLIDNETELVALKRKGYNHDELIKNFMSTFESLEDCNELTEKMGFDSAEEMVGKIIAFGPKRIGPNMLIEGKNVSKFKHLFGPSPEVAFDAEANIVNGFQLAVNEGPLASEPMQGVAVIINRCDKVESDDDDTPFLGQQGRIMTHTRDLIHEDFLLKGARLFMAMYTCEIQTSTEALGKVYAVVQKRGGSIISEEMKEGTPFFTVEARIPVIEAYGFSEEIRRRTSGAASPQLVFDGYDMLDIDPFWVPHTEEELEELGEFAERENKGRRYMNNVRRRKGLFVDEKVVQNAEKQRTMKKD